MPRHQSKIAFAVERNPSQPASKQADFVSSKPGLAAKRVDTRKVLSRTASSENESSGALERLLYSRDARMLLEKMQSDRIAVPTHPDSLSPGERLLHLFDVSSKYGPAQGMSRLDRWVRAEKLGMRPPNFIRTLLTAAKESPDYDRYEMSVFGALH